MMRIERIISTNLTGVGDVDLTFPVGPVVLFSKDSSRQRRLGTLLLKLFYDLKQPSASKVQSSKGLVEVWLSAESSGFHIRREFSQQADELEWTSTLEIEAETGQQVSLPETMTLGDYLFRTTLRAFREGGVLEWPENKDINYFFRRVRNLQQGGEEGLSLTKVRASMAGAQKRVKEQTESMALVKAEYDALRHEWEEAHRLQENERVLRIELKNLQEKEKILAEKMSYATKIQERITVLRQNPDYRELRHLQSELTQLEERSRDSAATLAALTHEPQVDWAVIEGLREECLDWAGLQEQVDRLAAKAQMLALKIYETQNSLQMSGYQGVSKNEVQRLRRAEEERQAAQEELELNNLSSVKSELEKIQIVGTKEIAKLQNLAVMAGVTEASKFKIAQKERHWAQWHGSKIGSFLDWALPELLGLKSIGARLSLRLAKCYQTYHVSNYKEFTNQLKEFHDQQQLVKRLQMELGQLQEKVYREEKLRKLVDSRTKTLERAFSTVNVADFPAWLNGWEDHQSKKHQLALWRDELQLELEQQQLEENKLAASVEQLREKLGNWETLTTDRDEVLTMVMKVARQLRVKDELEKEVALFAQRYYDLLGDRKLEHLAKILEPLADLERETLLSEEEGMTELAARQKERAEIRHQLEATKQSLQNSQKFTSLSSLEKKIETVKRQWMAYEDLNEALDDAQTMLEASWQEWKTKCEKPLRREKQWILSQMPSLSIKETIKSKVGAGQRDYFAYRMASAQLALGANLELPLLFSIGEMNEEQSIWEEISGYLRKLSLSRQVVLVTSNTQLCQKLAANSWQRIVV